MTFLLCWKRRKKKELLKEESLSLLLPGYSNVKVIRPVYTHLTRIVESWALYLCKNESLHFVLTIDLIVCQALIK